MRMRAPRAVKSGTCGWVGATLAGLLALAGLPSGTHAQSAPSLPEGTRIQAGRHVIELGDPRLARVWYYSPTDSGDNLQPVVIIHGSGRNADDYLDAWIPFADERGLFLIAPEFPQLDPFMIGADWAPYPFHVGNVMGPEGPYPEESWYFTWVDQLAGELIRLHSGADREYVLFGHSAGGQFVHRMLLFFPTARFGLAIAANSGWYTVVDGQLPFPYGVLNAPTDGERLRAALNRSLIVHLGMDDSAESGGFRTTEEAMLQGASRPARGEHFFRVASAYAEDQGMTMNWSLEREEGIGHDFREMARAAVRLMTERGFGSDDPT